MMRYQVAKFGVGPPSRSLSIICGSDPVRLARDQLKYSRIHSIEQDISRRLPCQGQNDTAVEKGY